MVILPFHSLFKGSLSLHFSTCKKKNSKSSFASNLFSSRMSNILKNMGKKLSSNKGTPHKVPKGVPKSSGSFVPEERSSYPRVVFKYKKGFVPQEENVAEVHSDAEAMDGDEISLQPHVPIHAHVYGHGSPWISLRVHLDQLQPLCRLAHIWREILVVCVRALLVGSLV